MASELDGSESEQQAPPKRVARAKRPYVDLKKLERLMFMNPTMEEVTYFFDTSPEHISELTSLNYGYTFTEFRDKFRVHLKASLTDRAIKRAMEGSDRMLENCLKHVCGWNTAGGGEPNQAISINLKYNLEEEPKHQIKDVNKNDPNS